MLCPRDIITEARLKRKISWPEHLATIYIFNSGIHCIVKVPVYIILTGSISVIIACMF